MENPKQLHPILDFSKFISPDQPGQLVLWGCFTEIGFIRGINERSFLVSLKQFLNGPPGSNITHFNFENNFHSLAVNKEQDFELFIDMLAENNTITSFEIGNNYIPTRLMTKLAKVIGGKTKINALSVRMHEPRFMQSQQNLPFLTCLAKELPHNIEKLDLSGNHINKEGLLALIKACKRLEYLLEVNLTNVTYVDLSPAEVYGYWLQIHETLTDHQNLIDAIMAISDTPAPEKPKLTKRRTIELSDDEQETLPKKVLKSGDKHIFFKQHDQPRDAIFPARVATIPAQTKSFTERLAAIDIDITTNNSLGVRSIELIYYEQTGDRKFMEDPYALFYMYQGNTYQRNYDNNFINKWIQTKRCVPYSQREFKEYCIKPNPFKKREIDKFIQGLEYDYRVKNSPCFKTIY